jgi:hypothetical protein
MCVLPARLQSIDYGFHPLGRWLGVALANNPSHSGGDGQFTCR